MSEPRYVYVAEQGCYSSRGVVGVYESPEAAMADLPVTDEMRKSWPDAGWHADSYSEPGHSWSNGCDWESAIDVTRYELSGESLPASSSPAQQALDALAFAHGAIGDAIGLDEGLDGVAGQKVLEMIDAALRANGRLPPEVPPEDHAVAPTPYWTASIEPASSPAWEPIASCPKDGTDVILFAAGGIFLGSYVQWDGEPPEGERNGWWWTFDGCYLDLEPSHWMPFVDPHKEQP